jgi:ABC-type branched-subunit amino acid transport system substrate-binding protein
MRDITRRGMLTTGLAASFLGGFLGRAGSQERKGLPLRIGTVLPSKTGEMPIRASINDFTGTGARMGALLADNSFGDAASQQGFDLSILLANSPSADSAVREAQRLVELENVCALIGGVGDGQAEVLSAYAEQVRIPFFNIGATDDALRGASCRRYTFHMEASGAMYLDAMAQLSLSLNYRRWFVVHEDTEGGNALMQRSKLALGRVGHGAEIAGTAAVPSEKAVYNTEIGLAIEANADVFILMLNPADQIAFLAQLESQNPRLPSLAFPATVTQTRDFIASVRRLAPVTNPVHRIGLWETTLTSNGADQFNDKYRSQWGEPTDPTAWAAYHAIKILIDSASAIKKTDAEALVSHLESSDATFDLLKGEGTSFRPWDHQLRQPLYAIRVNEDIKWSRNSLDSRIGIASFDTELPEPASEGDASASKRLDRLGDNASQSACRFQSKPTK